MPKYTAKRDTWLSHECRLVKAGETFETTFPKAKTGKKGPDGKQVEVEMTLSDNLEPAKKGADKADGEGSEQLA